MSITAARPPRIALVEFGGTGVAPRELTRVAAALQKQIHDDFALPPPHGYGILAQVRAAADLRDVQRGEWLLGLFERPDQPDALGYHDMTRGGQPFMKVFPPLDRQEGNPWSATASHELLETLADPNLARAAQSPDGVFWAYEVCDAVEEDSYLVGGVAVSNFVLPLYFESPTYHPPKGVKLDKLGLVTRPYELRPGGYNQFWDGGEWIPVEASRARARSVRQLMARQYGRGARRRNKPLVQNLM
jgi:hypothetical protein